MWPVVLFNKAGPLFGPVCVLRYYKLHWLLKEELQMWLRQRTWEDGRLEMVNPGLVKQKTDGVISITIGHPGALCLGASGAKVCLAKLEGARLSGPRLLLCFLPPASLQ